MTRNEKAYIVRRTAKKYNSEMDKTEMNQCTWGLTSRCYVIQSNLAPNKGHQNSASSINLVPLNSGKFSFSVPVFNAFLSRRHIFHVHIVRNFRIIVRIVARIVYCALVRCWPTPQSRLNSILIRQP